MHETFLDVGLPLCLCHWGPALDAARSERPPVLILHGFLEQGAAWHPVAERLAAAIGRPIVAPDHRGHGRSGHVGPAQHYHFWDYVGDVQAIVDHLGGRVDLVGHSMGGTMASLFAGSRPEAVRRLVLVEGLGPPDLEAVQLQLARQFLDSRRTLRPHPVMADVDEAAKRMQRFNRSLDDETARRLAGRLTKAQGEGVTWGWDARHRARNPYPFQDRLFLGFLEAIEAPTLLVDGAESSYAKATPGPRIEAVRAVERRWIQGAGHLLHHDRPEALADVIGAFLEPTPNGARL